MNPPLSKILRRAAALTLATAAAGTAAYLPAVVPAGRHRAEQARPVVERTPAPDGAEPSGPSTGTPLPDGRHVGRILAAYVAPDEVVFDAIDGSSPVPVTAAVDAGDVDCRPGRCVEGAPGDYGGLTLDLADPGTAARHTWAITVRDGVVVQIDEQHLPEA